MRLVDFPCAGRRFLVAICLSSSSIERRAMARIGVTTTVGGGSMTAANSRSSMPTIDRSAGTLSFSSRTANSSAERHHVRYRDQRRRPVAPLQDLERPVMRLRLVEIAGDLQAWLDRDAVLGMRLEIAGEPVVAGRQPRRCRR